MLQLQEKQIMSVQLVDYLASLNSAESQWGIWVNPENPEEEYRIGQNCFDNGGIVDDWIKIGDLDDLSFGSQSTEEAFQEAATLAMPNGTKFNKEALYSAFCENRLPPKLQKNIQESIDSIHEEWSKIEAEFFVAEKMPEIISESLAPAY